METTTCSFSHAIVKYVKDSKRDLSVPIGVAMWSDDAGWVSIRVVQSDERVQGISKVEDYPYIKLVSQKLADWLKGEPLPYETAGLRPTTDAWWRHLQKVLIHKVRISEPRSIDCRDPENEINSLYQDIVNPEGADEGTQRIDGLISGCLGKQLSKRFKRAGEINGYYGKPVQVMRLLQGKRATVVVEGVNLSIPTASKEADELVSKLWRARSNGQVLGPGADGRKLVAIVGYVSPRGGLNGETYLREWIEKGGSAKVFDVVHERAALHAAALQAAEEAEDTLLS